MTVTCKCNHCSGGIQFDDSQTGQTVMCPHCGLDTVLYVPPQPQASPPPVTQQQPPQIGGETVFFKDHTVLVTNTRFVVRGRIFPLNAIASVEAGRVAAKTFWPLVAMGLTGMILVGAIPTIKQDLGMFLFVLVLLVASVAFFIYRSRAIYQVVISTSGGQISALTSQDRDYIDLVTSALSNAIIHRG